MTALLLEINPACLEQHVSYDWRATSLKSLKHPSHSHSNVPFVSHAILLVFLEWHIWSGHTQTAECVCYRLQQGLAVTSYM